MSLTVCKFGGSSVSDAGMFVRVNRIIGSDTARKYIVLSAPGKRHAGDEKITDLLFCAFKGIQRGDISSFTRIFNRYASIRDALCPSFDLEGEFAGIRSRMHTSIDYALSRGEYLCAKLFAAYTGKTFLDAAGLFIFTSEGKIDKQATYEAIRSRLLPLKEAVIPGFYGADENGRIRTFSRGGSDITGALVAAALKADLYENWTDVDGLYTADPAIVPHVRRNSRVSFRQMERIASAGARLLHPEALSPLRGTGIPTVLKNTFAPGGEGTEICDDFTGKVKCVTGQRNLWMIGDPDNEDSIPLLHSSPITGGMEVSAVRAFGLSEDLAEEIRRLLNPIHIIHMQDHIQIIVPDKEYESAVRAVHEIMFK